MEIEDHFDKMVQVSNLTPYEIKTVIGALYQCITFMDDDLIPWDNYVEALRIVRDIDPYDVTFVALNDFMQTTLWTGDQSLNKGLKAKGYERVVNFQDIRNRHGVA